MLPIKFDGPIGGLPDPDEDIPICLLQQMRQQFSADAPIAYPGLDVGVANQHHILDWLHAHHADEPAIILETSEFDARRNFFLQFRHRNIRLVPLVGRNHALVSLEGIINEGENVRGIGIYARPDYFIWRVLSFVNHVVIIHSAWQRRTKLRR